jgi:hypothetical protein
VLPDSAGPRHPYIGASASCWALYGELLVREYGELRYPRVHRLTVDAYAVQHPGGDDRRAVQSVAVHLASLLLVLEGGVPPERATAEIRALLRRAPGFERLEPPSPNGTVTVLDVLAADGAVEHERAVERWAREVWRAWSRHHATVMRWLGA